MTTACEVQSFPCLQRPEHQRVLRVHTHIVVGVHAHIGVYAYVCKQRCIVNMAPMTCECHHSILHCCGAGSSAGFRGRSH